MVSASFVPFAVVTGMHRSGTTLTGRLLAQYRSLHIIHEPLNKEYGLRGVEHVYPCDISEDQEAYYLALLNKLMDNKADIVRRIASDPPLKRIARAVIGGRTGYDLLRYRLRCIRNKGILPVLKDPFELMLTRSLCQRGSRVIVMVRHPAAVWLSIRRMKWKFNFDTFAYPDVFDDLGLPVSFKKLAPMDELERFAWLWMTLYTYLTRLKGFERLLLVRHEDLSLRPYEELSRIERFLGLGQQEKVRRYVDTHFFAETVEVTGNQLHVLERNANKLATSWMFNIDRSDEDRMSHICGTLVEDYYGSWRTV